MTGTTVTVRLSNSGTRTGREIVQIYVAPTDPDTTRPARWLAGFASVEARPARASRSTIELPGRAFEIWDEKTTPGRRAGLVRDRGVPLAHRRQAEGDVRPLRPRGCAISHYVRRS